MNFPAGPDPKASPFDDLDPQALRARHGIKWRSYPQDVLAAWVADMDFPQAECVRRALRSAIDSGDLGYPENAARHPVRDAFCAWAQRRYGWQVDAERVEILTDVVQGLYFALNSYSAPGDGALIFTPIYPPFLSSVAETGRRGILLPMVLGSAGYGIDFDALRRHVDKGTRLLMLCNPHNPTGRMLERAELETLAEIAIAHDLVVVSDEIHADLSLDGTPHVPFATLSPEAAARSVTLMAASKAFNIAGLRCAVAVFGSRRLQEAFNRVPWHQRGAVNALGMLASQVAWTEGEPWLRGTLDYLRGNRDFLCAWLAEHMPEVDLVPPQGTYLAWLDCRRLGLNVPPAEHFLERGRVALSDGARFGPPGEGFVRLNFATSRTLLERILERMRSSLL